MWRQNRVICSKTDLYIMRERRRPFAFYSRHWHEAVVTSLLFYSWRLLNRIIWNRTVWSFNCVWANDRYLIELLVIIVIIMSCRQHGYPWPFLTTSTYHSSPLAGLQGYTPYPHIAAACMFELVVLLLLGHMRGSIWVHHLWARPCFDSSVLHVWFVYLG